MTSQNGQTVNKKLVVILATGLAGLILALGFRLFLPFFEPIAWAIILVLFFHPVYRSLRRLLRGGETFASLGMCLLIILFIILPVFALLASVTSEVIRVYMPLQHSLQAGDFSIVPDPDRFPLLHKGVTLLMEALKTHEAGIKASLVDMSSRTGEFFLKQGTVVFRNVTNVLFKAALMLVTLYFLFRDGERLLQAFKDLLPLPPGAAQSFISVAQDVLSATLYGNILTAGIQAGLGIFILWALDFSAPVLWGIVMGLTAFVPLIGASLVWAPCALYLFASGLYLKGAILLVFSVLVISQIDYFLRPYLISGKTQLHTLFLFFSILGGLHTFGLLGFILGPILVGLCVAILEIYRTNFLGRY